MNVLSLFDGVSCAKLALNRAGIKVNKYYASEIDKYAIKVSKANHPDIIHIGDVRNVNWFGLPKIDLLLGGSPCQGFSFAGKGLNFEDERSKLFFDFVRILNELKPRYFLLENVPMKKEYENIISELVGCKPILINSSLLSAQHRKRLYWSNIPNIDQPKDKNIILKDVIEDGFVDCEKSYAVLPGVYDKAHLNHYHNKRMHQIVKLGNTNPSGIGQNGNVVSIEGKASTVTTNKGEGAKIGLIKIGEANLSTSRECDKRVYSIEGKAPTLLANSGGHKEPKIEVKCGAIRGRYLIDNKRGDNKVESMKGLTTQRIEVRNDDKTNCLLTIEKDNILILQKPRGFNKGGEFTEKSPTLSAHSWQENNHLTDGVYWRKLTVKECCRLQTIPDNYFDGIVSNSQAYKALGNGWTVDVIAHILKGIKNDLRRI